MTQYSDLRTENYRHLEAIFQFTVEKTRKILKGDRVIIYDASELPKSTIIAESVAPKYTSIKGITITNPFLATEEYLEMYCYGQAVAINDISATNISKSRLEDLERLKIKSLSIAPIFINKKLLAFLDVHQCSKLRIWNSEAIKFLSERANAASFALSNMAKDRQSKLTDDADLSEQKINWITKTATQEGIMLEYTGIFAQTDSESSNSQKLLAESENEWNQLFIDAIQYIRASINEEDILKASVKEVRRVLECDRVVVYSMNQDDRGEIVAESVAAGWTRAKGRVIEDPCFEAKYLDMYRNGRVRAWSDIYESGLTPCYIEQLEQLEVKANLVTPIINEGKLFGLLVAHQCSDFRNWQQLEIRWVAQIATQVGFALDNAKSLAEAKHLKQQVRDESKWTEYLTDTIQHIRESLKTEDILKTSVKEVRRILECDRVVVYSMNQDDRGEIVAESVAAGWTRAKGRVIEDPCFEAKYLDMYRNGRVRAWSNIYEAGMSKCYIEQLEQLEVKANLVTPIINEGKLFGLLVAHQCSAPREWQQAEIRWIAQIATQVGFALDNAKLLKQLKESERINNQVSNQQHEQTETFKHQVVEILADNGNAYQTLSQEAMRQSETTINVLHQIQKVVDSFDGIAFNMQQVKFQEQQNDLAVKDTKESLELAVSSISDIQRTVQDAAVGFDNVSSYSQKLSETVNTIRNVSKQIVQQSMNMTKAVNRSQIEAGSQNSVMDLSDNIFSLMQQLYEASAEVEPLFANIRTEIKEKTTTLDSGTQQLINGVGEFQLVRQKLDRVVTLHDKMNTLIENISQSVENQTQSSTFAKDSVQEVASIAERISAHSMTITQSFNQLVVLIQKL